MLNDKQIAFVEHYCTDAAFNASLAYKVAYPLCKSGHKQAGSRLLTNVDVKQAIDEHKAEIKAESGYDIVNWLKDTRTARKSAFDAKNWSAVAAFDRLLAQHTGALELDNRQRQAQLGIAIKAEQVAIDAALAKALDGAQDALVR